MKRIQIENFQDPNLVMYWSIHKGFSCRITTTRIYTNRCIHTTNWNMYIIIFYGFAYYFLSNVYLLYSILFNPENVLLLARVR